jgi:lysophospholipase L1-like esterase
MKTRPLLFAAIASALFAVPGPAAEAVKPTPKPRRADDASTPAPVNIARQRAFLERAKDKSIGIVFLGDSITDFWLRDDGKHGKAVWDEFYAKYNAANFGVSGEHTEHTLGHIAGGIFNGLHPSVVVIMIGTNNIGHIPDERPEWVAAGIRKIVATVHDKLPDTKVLLLGIFPREGKASRHRRQIEEINSIISRLEDGKKTRYLDITPKFLDEKGEIPKSLMPDGLHPNTAGYRVWAEAMRPLLSEMMRQ